MHEEKCSICLKNATKIVAVEEFSLDKVKYIDKLIDFVPEINWNNSHFLCVKCCDSLNESYDFKKLCLKSLLYQETITFQPKINEISVLSDSETDRSSKITTEGIINDNELICYHCKGVFTSKSVLIEHIREEHNINNQKLKKKSKSKSPNVCTICKNMFLTKYLLNRHIKNVHANEKLFDCDVCGQKFASQVYLSAHKMYHRGERSHMCSYCGKSFITKSDLSHHEKIHANKRDYKCLQCPKAFNTSSDLHKHRICVHFDKTKWKYICGVCNKRFPLKTNLDSHTKTHTGEKNFACHICDRKCVSKSVLQRHIESHSNIRLFKCSECGLEYKYQRSLDVHLAKAHGIGEVKLPERVKKHFCHICPKSYYANNKLQKHIRSHTGEKPFQCLTCGKGFIDKSYIKQHMKMVHDVE